MPQLGDIWGPFHWSEDKPNDRSTHWRCIPASAPIKVDIDLSSSLRSAVVRLMELLAADHSDEEPDAGAMEGCGDDYEE